ncbi:MAG: hypothetical protein B1H05_03555 [Candidatus Cloacimonas sp. 4484_140]|nr:MAG: hypothetical protein B1H05_03555 [Candidatus Cloacimonas sp. 4484_140]
MEKTLKTNYSKIQPLIYLIALLILVNPLFFNTQKLLFFPVKIIIQQILILAILLFYIFSKDYNKIKLSYPIIIITIYIVYLLLRTLLQPVPVFGFQQLYYLFPYALLFIIISQLQINKKEKLFISNTFLFSFIISILFGVYLQAKHSSFSNFSRLQLTWANSNYLASYLLVTIGFVVFSWKTSREKWIRYIALASLVVALIFMLWTQSRGGLVSLILVLLFIYIIYSIKQRKRLHIIISIALLLLLVISSYFVFKTIRPQTVTFRARIYKADAEYIKHNWLAGSGLGTFVREFPQYRLSDYKLIGQEDIISHAHNEFIEIWAETGIIGLALFIIFLIALFGQYKRNLKSNNKYFIYAIAFSLILLLIHNLFSITMRIPPILIYFFILAGLLSANYSNDAEKKSKSVNKYILILFVLALLVCIFQQYRNVQGLKHFSRSEEYLASKDSNLLTGAILEAKKAHKYIPNNTDFLYYQGLLYTFHDEYAKALQAYDRLEQISPYYPQLHFWKGYVLSLKGDWNSALDEFKTEIKYNQYPKVYFNIAIAYHYLNEENNSMIYFMYFVEKIKEKIERHLIKNKERILEEEGKNLKFALDKLANFHKNNPALINRINYLSRYFFYRKE